MTANFPLSLCPAYELGFHLPVYQQSQVFIFPFPGAVTNPPCLCSRPWSMHALYTTQRYGFLLSSLIMPGFSLECLDSLCYWKDWSEWIQLIHFTVCVQWSLLVFCFVVSFSCYLELILYLLDFYNSILSSTDL